jgi:hypothetical protein
MKRLHVGIQLVSKLRQPARMPFPFFLAVDLEPLQGVLELADHFPFVGFVRVQLEAVAAEADALEPPVHNVERRHLFGDEEDRLPLG